MALRFKNVWAVRGLFVFDLGIPVFAIITGVIAGAAIGAMPQRLDLKESKPAGAA